MDESEIAQYIALGQENARTIELAAQHCRLMRFEQDGGRGLLEEFTGLPLDPRRVECPVALGNSSAMRLEYVVFEFFAAHCQGCQLREATGRLPNLQTEYEARQGAVQAADEERGKVRRQLAAARAVRTERRRGLRVTADPAVTALLDDLDVIDHDPEIDTEKAAEEAAQRRLLVLASRAGDRFGAEVVDEILRRRSHGWRHQPPGASAASSGPSLLKGWV